MSRAWFGDCYVLGYNRCPCGDAGRDLEGGVRNSGVRGLDWKYIWQSLVYG